MRALRKRQKVMNSPSSLISASTRISMDMLPMPPKVCSICPDSSVKNSSARSPNIPALRDCSFSAPSSSINRHFCLYSVMSSRMGVSSLAHSAHSTQYSRALCSSAMRLSNRRMSAGRRASSRFRPSTQEKSISVIWQRQSSVMVTISSSLVE